MLLINRHSWIVFCLAYIIGLFATGLFYFNNEPLSFLIYLKIGFILAFFCILNQFLAKKIVDRRVCLIAIIIAYLAVIYFSLRIPQPKANDISYFIDSGRSNLVTVTGKVLNEPRLNSNHKLKFWLQVQEVNKSTTSEFEKVSGKLYVTLPLLEGKQIYPSELVTIKGTLYKPKAPNNSQQFNFQRYLQNNGTFAGLSGFKLIDRSSKSTWGWYQLRKRIVRAQMIGLGSPLGQLVSSIVLGQRAVDLPEDIRNLFIKSGLAHVLAASGFQVSLLLGFVLKITNFLNTKKQVVFGCLILIIYSCLTGFSPSVFRATIMGFAVLFALVNQAKIRPDGSLLLAATILLLINPLWIWDLGFQLSFLATLGLIITLPALEKRLDWLPPNLTNAIAIPLAASLWTLPLISYVFNTVAVYSIFVNVVTTPLISIISLGGMLSSVISLIFPVFGSYIAWLLKYPTLLLIGLTKFFTNLPGSTWSIGEISLFLLLLIYSLMIFLWLTPKSQKYWLPILILVTGLIIVPLHYQKANLLQVTVLHTDTIPTVLIQDRGKVILVNSSKAQDIQYTILPFLASQGVNHLDYVMLNLQQIQNNQDGLQKLQSRIKINQLFVYDEFNKNYVTEQEKINIPRENNSTIKTDSLLIQTTDNSQALQLTVNNQQWLLTDTLSSLKTKSSDKTNVLLWLGESLNEEVIKHFSGQVAIALSAQPLSNIINPSFQLYTTDHYGIINWTPQKGFFTALDKTERNNNF